MKGLVAVFSAFARLASSVNAMADAFDDATNRVRGQLDAGPEQIEGEVSETPKKRKTS